MAVSVIKKTHDMYTYYNYSSIANEKTVTISMAETNKRFVHVNCFNNGDMYTGLLSMTSGTWVGVAKNSFPSTSVGTNSVSFPLYQWNGELEIQSIVPFTVTIE